MPSVSYCGFKLLADGYRVDNHLVKALHSFLVPTKRTDVRSFCGLVRQFHPFSRSLTPMLAPIRSLLSPKSAFVWKLETPHQEAFQPWSGNSPTQGSWPTTNQHSLCGWRPKQPKPRVLEWPSGSSSPPESGESSNVALALSPQPSPDTQQQRWNPWRSCGSPQSPPVLSWRRLWACDWPSNSDPHPWALASCPLLVWSVGRRNWSFTSSLRCSDLVSSIILWIASPTTRWTIRTWTMSKLTSRQMRTYLRCCSKPSKITPPTIGFWHFLRTPTPRFSKQKRIETLNTNHFLPQPSMASHPTRADSTATLDPSWLEVLRELLSSHQGQDRTLRRVWQVVYWPSITNDIRNDSWRLVKIFAMRSVAERRAQNAFPHMHLSPFWSNRRRRPTHSTALLPITSLAGPQSVPVAAQPHRPRSSACWKNGCRKKAYRYGWQRMAIPSLSRWHSKNSVPARESVTRSAALAIARPTEPPGQQSRQSKPFSERRVGLETLMSTPFAPASWSSGTPHPFMGSAHPSCRFGAIFGRKCCHTPAHSSIPAAMVWAAGRSGPGSHGACS